MSGELTEFLKLGQNALRIAAQRDEARADLNEALALLREAEPAGYPAQSWQVREQWNARRDALLAKHTPTERDR